MLRWIANVIWFLFGGLVMGLGWWLAGLVAAITIVGIPWAKACFMIGNFSFWPFGKQAVSRREITGRMDLGTGPLGVIGNVIWFLLAGWWLAIGHLSSALACFVTIIGIPFGLQHLKLALIALAPIGMEVVPATSLRVVAKEAEQRVPAWRRQPSPHSPLACSQDNARQRSHRALRQTCGAITSLTKCMGRGKTTSQFVREEQRIR